LRLRFPDGGLVSKSAETEGRDKARRARRRANVPADTPKLAWHSG
jgi:hypothetical protein